MKHDASLHDPRPEYLRALLASAGLTQEGAADALRISHRMMRYYLALDPQKWKPAPFLVVRELERLALK